METEIQQFEWDISIDGQDDVIFIDTGDGAVYLTISDLQTMLQALV